MQKWLLDRINSVFFSLNENLPAYPCSPVQNSKEYIISREATQAIFNLDKRISIQQPFLHWILGAIDLQEKGKRKRKAGLGRGRSETPFTPSREVIS